MNCLFLKVTDAYRWLENPDSGETSKFVAEQNNLTRKYIQQNICQDQISQK